MPKENNGAAGGRNWFPRRCVAPDRTWSGIARGRQQVEVPSVFYFLGRLGWKNRVVIVLFSIENVVLCYYNDGDNSDRIGGTATGKGVGERGESDFLWISQQRVCLCIIRRTAV